MNIKNLLRSFKTKLLLECFLHASVISLMLGAISIFIISLVYHILLQETPLDLVAIIGGGVFALSFLTLFILRYPTAKRVAARVDAMGLQERASTMLEYQNENTPMAQLQRSDAVEHIRKTSPHQMPLVSSSAHWILCLACICLALGMLVMPVNAFSSEEMSTVEQQEQQQFIKDLIDQLREEVKQAELEEQLQEELEQLIDQLEQDLQSAETELDQAGQIQEAIRDMEQLLEESLTKNQIGEALQKYELTRPLGEAVSDGDAEKVSSAMNDLESALVENTDLVRELSDTVAAALADSEVAEDDALYMAFNDFSYTLLLLDTTAEDFPENLSAFFDDAEAAILAALEQQNAIDQLMGEMEDTMEEAKDEVLGIEPEETTAPTEGESSEGGEEGSEGTEPTEGEGSEGTEGEESEGGEEGSEGAEGQEPTEGEGSEGAEGEGSEGAEGTEGEGSEGGEGSGTGEGEGMGSTMTEEIYDPISGNVTYGDVFAAYYAKYLEALEAGEVPEDLQEIMDQYFGALD